MRIKAVKVAQSIRLNGRQWTTLNVKDPSAPKGLQLDWKAGTLYVSTDKELIIITGNNAAYMEVLDVAAAKKTLQLNTKNNK